MIDKTKTASILVVDDTLENLDVLKNILSDEHYEVRPLPNGELALRAAQAEVPDLILLDIMMPNMDGYEVCAQLKADPRTRNVPVIFVSALQETEDKLRAFSVGGVDYVSKPFQAEEVLARVSTHLQLARIQRELRDSKQLLEEKNAALVQLNQEKNEFLGIAAHDLKNPLAGIRGYAHIIKTGANINSAAQISGYADIIEDSARKMFTLITNLLDVNAIEDGKMAINMENMDCISLLKDIATEHGFHGAKKQIRVNLTLPDSVPQVVSHSDTLQQILDNLVSNAVKYSPLGSQVDISLQITSNAAQIRIQDQGPGFTEADKAKLFNKFARLSAKPTGGEHSTGLGLFIVRKLVEALHSKVWCESQTGQGACFVLELPLVQGKTPTLSLNLRVLVAEDNQVNQKITLLTLKKLGLQADMVDNGKQVLDMLAKQPRGTYDVILMDIHMPDMDGLQATAAIHQRYGAERPRIIALTANALERDACLNTGMDGYLLKPFKSDNLVQALANVLG